MTALVPPGLLRDVSKAALSLRLLFTIICIILFIMIYHMVERLFEKGIWLPPTLLVEGC